MPGPRSVVIVGASLAGFRCAGALRRHGFSGDLTLVGDETHPPYDRPPLSKQVLAGDWQPERTALATADDITELDIELTLAETAVGLDPTTRTVRFESGAAMSADAVVIATGARARSLPGSETLAGVYTLRTLGDAVALRAELDAERRRVVVVGAGFIGAEVAATASTLGHRVSMIEADTAPLGRALGTEMGLACSTLHTDNGVELLLGTSVDSIDTYDGRVEGVALSTGERIEADLVVVGIGVVPNTEWLRDAGVDLDDGVLCNEFCEAADGIYAAGDVARWPNRRYGETMRVEHWQNAIEQGVYVAGRMVGEEREPFAPVPWFWSDQYGHKIQLAGRPQPGDEVEVIHGSVADHKFVAVYGSGGSLSAVLGIDRPRHVVQLRQLLVDGGSRDDALALVGG